MAQAATGPVRGRKFCHCHGRSIMGRSVGPGALSRSTGDISMCDSETKSSLSCGCGYADLRRRRAPGPGEDRFPGGCPAAPPGSHLKRRPAVAGRRPITGPFIMDSNIMRLPVSQLPRPRGTRAAAGAGTSGALCPDGLVYWHESVDLQTCRTASALRL